MQDDIDLAGMAGNGLIDTVIDHFLCQVIGAAGIGIHTWPFLHRLKTG